MCQGSFWMGDRLETLVAAGFCLDFETVKVQVDRKNQQVAL